MDKTFTQRLFLLAIFTLFTFTGVFAQTITVGSVDPGPYGQGSSIAVPINVNTTSGCINSGNTYNVYLSDASGNFSPGTLIGSGSNAYTTFINATIPNGTPAGAGYKVEVKSTSPAVTSTVSAAFAINNNPGVTASLSSTETVATGVFGRCVGSTSPYTITSAAGGTVTASFFNESTQASEGSNVSVPPGGYAFTPALGNYTMTGKSVDASGTVGTYAYQLINNVVVNPFSPFGTPFVCIPAGGTGDLQFIMPITGPGGIINNYPGTTYTVNWGDGTSTTFDYCQIVALGGILTHTYTLPSCGQTSTGGATNSLTVVSHAISPYCLELASPATTSAKVIIQPITSFNAPSVACVGTALTIPNTSTPGPDYSPGAASTCTANPGALYDWTLDGNPVAGYQGVLRSVSFIFPTTTTPGIHTLKLHSRLPISGIGCAAPDYTQDICFENPPQPVFTIPAEICVTSGPVTPTNTSTIDATCGVDTYTWITTGPQAVTYAGGTNANSQFPQFVFPVAGVYTVQLGINSGGCGLIKAAVQTIRVDAAPTASLSPDIIICGNNLSFTFDPSQTVTKTILSGTAQAQPDTYTWTITGGAFSFVNGTDQNSQYPKILFADFAPYTIQVTHKNACGTITKTQMITFVQAPTVDAGIDQNICASTPTAPLVGSITGSYTSFQWMGGTGTFSAGRNSLTTTYTPSAAEITAGQVTLTLQANTALPAPCDKVTDDIVINITPTVFITSPPTAELCSGNTLVYTITANSTLATFAWTASVTSGTATGFTASGTSANINDVITNSGNVDAVVTYHILPSIGSCPGTPFVLTVTIHPLPVLTPPVNTPVCNNQPANIALASNVVGTTYTWTSTAGANISGNTTQSTPATTSSIQDILNNSGTIAQTVTYVVTPYNGTCPGTPVTTTVTVEPSVIPSVVGPDQRICSTTAPYTLPGNDPAPFTGKWTQVDANPVVTFSDNTKFDATVTGMLAGNTYQFKWTITGSASCPTSSSTFTIIIDNPAVGGTATPNPADVCSGNGSNITLTGYANTVVQWESSIDGTTWSVITNTTNTLTTAALAQTTFYRALVHNGLNCPDVYSSTATVTVHQPPTIADAGPDNEVCNSPSYALQGNTPTSGTGIWTADINNPTVVAFVNANDHTTQVNGLVPGSYTFTWTITASASCPPSAKSVTIKVDSPPIGGTASALPAEICKGDGSQLTLTGSFGTVVEWQILIGGTWQGIPNSASLTTLPVVNLTQTTQYRARLTNGGVCPDAFSTPATVTVDPPPTIADAGPDDEVCSSATPYQLHANTPTSGTGLWTQDVNNPAGATFANAGDPNTKVNGLAPGTYKFIWTITASATCPPSSSTVKITVDPPPVGGVATALPAEVCSGSSSQVTLTGYAQSVIQWESSTDNTHWSVINNTTNTLTTAALTQTTFYRALVHNGANCADVYSSTATVTVDQPPTMAVAGPNDEVCNSAIYTLQGNTPTSGTGKWTQDASNPAGATFANVTNPNTTVNGLAPGIYRFIWTITASATCPPTSSTVKITIDSPPVGGTTAGIATVCSGDNNGQIALTGQTGTVKEWQSSTDGINYFPLASAGTGTTMTYASLTQTTYYRALVTNGTVCPDIYSTPTKITVNPTTPLANAGPDQGICNQNYADMVGNDPGTLFSGVWTQTSGPAVTIVNPNDPHTRITGLTRGSAYTFKWTIIGLAPCGNTEDLVNITATSDVIPSFAMNQNHACGVLTVNFTNTSTPSPTGTFVWDFGDGSPAVTAINPPPHTFPVSTDGTEKTYRITLTPLSNCGSQAPYQADVTVSPAAPVASMSPNQASACGTFALKVENHSPGDNAKYDYYLKDAGGTVVQHISVTDKNDVTFQPIVPTVATNYTITLTVTDKCGNQVSTIPQIISVSPSTLVSQIQIKGGIESVCLGNPVTFQNISTGGDRFTIKLYDSGHNLILTLPAGSGETNYTPTAAGNYYVTITAGNEGCGDAPASAERQFTVYPIPQPNFTYTSDKDYNITFTNTTPNDGNIPASSVLYSWNFGDGSPNETAYTPNTHRFDYAKSPFTVTLTATTPGSTCSNIFTQTINVKFLGNLFLPNAFIPTSSNSQLKTYMAKGFGMKTWKMQIFNNFGQLVWETTKLDNNGAPVEGWDGTYKGQIVEQGVYIWQITATLLNGEDWKGMSYNNSSPSRTGAIHLIR